MCAVQLRPSCLPLSFLRGTSGVTVNSSGKRACMLSRFSRIWLCATLWTVARHAPLSMRFSRQEDWSGLPRPPPGGLPEPQIEPSSLMSPALAGGFFTTSTSWEACGKHGRGKKRKLFLPETLLLDIPASTHFSPFFLSHLPPSISLLPWAGGDGGCLRGAGHGEKPTAPATLPVWFSSWSPAYSPASVSGNSLLIVEPSLSPSKPKCML